MRRSPASLTALALLAAALLLSCKEGVEPLPQASFSPDASYGEGTKQDAGKAVTLATWNVEGFDLGGKAPAGTYSGIATALKDASVEVAALEEVQTDDIEKLKAALKDADCGMPYVACSSLSDRYNALAVASAYPILEAKEILSASPRTVFKVRLDVGKGLTLFVCHLKSGTDSPTKRIAQARALADYLRNGYPDSISSAYLAVLGDMNTMSEADRSGSGSTLACLQLKDDSLPANDFTSLTEELLYPANSYSWEGTINGVLTQSSLDHIILSPAAKAHYVKDSLKIYRSDPNVTMQANSDHFPVVLDIDL
jgi:endonuclease/exonuclease/phosphatase family metal-dependent hydrolase